MIANSLIPQYPFAKNKTPQLGEVSFDLGANKMMVFDGNIWNEVVQNVHDDHNDFNSLLPYEIIKVRRFIDNMDKYEKILKEHFPEDYL